MKMKAVIWVAALVLGIAVPCVAASLVVGEYVQPSKSVLTTAPTILEPETTNQEALHNIPVPIQLKDGTIRTMDLEEYITGVVLQEMPASFEMEALKAQAIVARTYTLKQLHTGKKHPGCAACTDSNCCQGYLSVDAYLANGGQEADVDKIHQAVYDTKELVLVYDGALIEATYFSCSGGKTEDAVSVWGTYVPYLQSVESPGEQNAVHYVDTMTFSKTEMEALLGQELSDNSQNWFGAVTYTAGGGVSTIEIEGKIYSGVILRRLLGLKSTAFVITAVGNSITITTKGFGHRVGMSQYGADAMAVDGATFEQILAHYYQGTQLQTVNSGNN